MSNDELLREIEQQRLLMIGEATGDSRGLGAEIEYAERRERIQAALRQRNLDDPNPFEALAAWRAKWRSGDLPKWADRREYVRRLYDPLVAAIKAGPRRVFVEPTGWEKVDRMLADVNSRLVQAKNGEDSQSVGHLCRELLVALSILVHDPVRHPPTDDKTPSPTDAKRKLDAYLAAELVGGSNEEIRKLARAAVDLANALQHRQGATLREAVLCAEGTCTVVNLVAIIAGRRNKPLASIREELAERLVRAEADAAAWKEKYETLAGFSPVLKLLGKSPEPQELEITARQEFEVIELAYCLDTGAIVLSTTLQERGRDVRAPINNAYVLQTFVKKFDHSQHIADIRLRVTMRAAGQTVTRELPARVEQDLATGSVRLIG